MKNIFLVFTIYMFTIPIMAQESTLIYVGDPMCSWCYGISDEYKQIVEIYKDEVNFKIVVGGLRAGGGEEWNQQFKDFLKHHWEDVGSKSGQQFRYKLFDQAYFDYDTEPACRAIVTARKMSPKKELDFFKAVQKGFYYENKDPKQVDFYQPICKDLGIDFEDFATLFSSEEMKKETAKDFQYSSEIGVRSFPTILLQKGNKMHVISQGYSNAKEMGVRIQKVIHQ